MFRFRLQRVLELRERKERDAATAIGAAEEQAEQARAEQERLEAARDAMAEMPAIASEASVGALRTFHFLLGRLDERVAHANAATASAEHTVTQKQDELRERHVETQRAAESAADRQQMDEIALTRFAQPGKTDTTPTPDSES